MFITLMILGPLKKPDPYLEPSCPHSRPNVSLFGRDVPRPLLLISLREHAGR